MNGNIKCTDCNLECVIYRDDKGRYIPLETIKEYQNYIRNKNGIAKDNARTYGHYTAELGFMDYNGKYHQGKPNFKYKCANKNCGFEFVNNKLRQENTKCPQCGCHCNLIGMTSEPVGGIYPDKIKESGTVYLPDTELCSLTENEHKDIILGQIKILESLQEQHITDSIGLTAEKKIDKAVMIAEQIRLLYDSLMSDKRYGIYSIKQNDKSMSTELAEGSYLDSKALMRGFKRNTEETDEDLRNRIINNMKGR